MAANRVVRTEPAAGNQVEEGSKVTIFISMPKDAILVPDVTGMSEAEATAKLESGGFKVEKSTEKSETVVKGNVVSQSPEGGSAGSYDVPVKIVISDGSSKEKVKMPDLTGMSEEEARRTVEEIGMTVSGVREDYSDTVEKGLICSQSYTVGSVVKEGSEVSLVKSLGPEPRYYSFDYMVQEPAEYNGGEATIIVRTLDGTELFNTYNPVFPYHIDLTQIYGVSKGILEVTYSVSREEQGIDDNGNVVVQIVPGTKTDTVEVEFE